MQRRQQTPTMPLRRLQTSGLSRSRSPSPTGSFDSTFSSSSTLHSPTASSSPPPSPPGTTTANPTSMYSNSTSTRPRRSTPPQRILGAIDEDSPTVQPDLPLSANRNSNPITKLHAYSAVTSSRHKPTLARTCSPPRNEFNHLTGPNGELFEDLRMNRKMDGAKSWKRLMCFG
jgi:hypothetical protein